VDNSSQALIRISIADKAFEARNFGEAYEFYNRALEDAPNDFKSLYRKGICAIYLSTPGNLRAQEFSTYIDSAKIPADLTDTARADMVLIKDKDVALMLKSLLGYCHSNSSTQPSIDSCKAVYRKLLSVAQFARTAIGCLENESVQESTLAEAVDYCDRVIAKRLNYVSGIKTDKKGRTSETISTYVMDNDSKKTITDLRTYFANMYNGLPSRVARNAVLNDSISNLEGDIKASKDAIKIQANDVKIARKNYYEASGLKAARHKAFLPSIITFGVLAIASVIFFLCKNNAIGGLLAVLAIIIPIFLAKFCVARFDASHLSAEIKTKASELREAKKQLAAQQKSLKGEQKDLKSFNKTKI